MFQENSYLADDLMATFVFVISRVISSMPLLKMSTLAYANTTNVNRKRISYESLRYTKDVLREIQGDCKGLSMMTYLLCFEL